MKYSRLFPLASLLGLALVSTGCVAAVPALMAASYASLGVTGVTMIRGTQIAQQNADTYRAQVQAQQASDAPQCREPDARAACPLYQHRVGIYRARCADGSGLDVSPGKLTVIPPAVERPRPWDADGCTL
jgi:hypothetical protein